MTVIELKQKRSALIEQARGIRNKAVTEKRTLTAEEKQEVDRLMTDAEGMEADITQEERLSGLEGQMRSNPGRQTNPADLITPGVEGAGEQRELRKMLGKYSLLRAIRCLAEKRPLDGVEAELSQEIEKRNGKSAQGFYVPHAVLSKRAFDTTAGAGAINNVVDYANFIDALRNKTLSQQLGVRIVSGLVGEVDIPKKTATTSAEWITEGTAASGTAPTVGQVQLRANTISARTDITRRMVNQSSMDMEQLTRDDLLESVAIKLDYTLFAGTGNSPEPRGLLNVVGLNEVDAGSDYWASVVGLEEKVETGNALEGTLAYVTSPKGRSKYKTTQKANNTAQYIWQPDNTINGYRAFSSNQIPSNLGGSGTSGDGTNTAAIFGNWADAIIAIWGSGVDVIVDPYSLSTSGGIRLVVLQDADIKYRNNASFARIVDLPTT